MEIYYNADLPNSFITLQSLGIELIDRIIPPTSFVENRYPPTPNTRPITLKFLIVAPTDWDAHLKISKLTQNMADCEVVFDDMADPIIRFPMKITSSQTIEKISVGKFTLEIEFLGQMAYNPNFKSSQGTGTQLTIDNRGTWSAPFRIHFVVPAGMSDLRINVGGTPIVLMGLEEGQYIEFNSIEYVVKVNGVSDINIMTSTIFPQVPTGMSIITFSQAITYDLKMREVFL